MGDVTVGGNGIPSSRNFLEPSPVEY